MGDNTKRHKEGRKVTGRHLCSCKEISQVLLISPRQTETQQAQSAVTKMAYTATCKHIMRYLSGQRTRLTWNYLFYIKDKYCIERWTEKDAATFIATFIVHHLLFKVELHWQSALFEYFWVLQTKNNHQSLYLTNKPEPSSERVQLQQC